MSAKSERSICASGISVEYYWLDCGAAMTEGHIATAVDELMSVIRKPGSRAWNPWLLANVRNQFRDRLREAARGELIPVDEVRGLRGETSALYEIRWNDIAVVNRSPSGELAHVEIGVRQIHAEAIEFSRAAIGLRAHEKPYLATDAETKNAQDHEIDLAEDVYFGRYNDWGFDFR